MDNLKTGTIDVHCTSGSIKGYDVSGVMQIKDTSGSINIDGELKDGASKISSVSGSINITISKRPISLDVKSSSGKVTINDTDMFNVEHKSKKSFIGEYKEQGEAGASLEASSTSASVTINFK